MAAKKKKVVKKKVVAKKIVKKVAKKRGPSIKKKPKLKAVRGTTKGTKNQAKLIKVEKKERLPRVGSTVIFTFKRGNERKESWGVGTITSVVGPMANVQVGGEEYGFNVIIHQQKTYKPTSIESSLHQFVIDTVFKSRKMKERELELDEKTFKKGFKKVEDIGEAVAVILAEEEAPKSDDLSVLYAAYAMKGPKAQQVVERAEDVIGHVNLDGNTYELREDGVVAFVHENLTEKQLLDIVREVQQTP